MPISYRILVTSFFEKDSLSQNSQYTDFIGKSNLQFFDFTSTPQTLIHQRFAGRNLAKTPIFVQPSKEVEVKFLSLDPLA